MPWVWLCASFGGSVYAQAVWTKVPRVEFPDIRYVDYESGSCRALFGARFRLGAFRVKAQVSHQLWLCNSYACEFNWQSLQALSPGFLRLQALSRSPNTIQMDYLRRATLSYQSRFLGLQLGRGVVSWNSTFFWSVLNIFTVQNNISGVPDDVPFCDFASLSLRPLSWASLQGVFSPADRDSASQAYRAGARISLNPGPIDLTLQLSYNRRDTLLGAASAFDVMDGTLRFEAGFRPSGSPSYVFGYDRRWPGGFYGVIEYYRNGLASNTAQPMSFGKKQYAGVFASKNWDVVWTASLYYMNCLADGSGVAGAFLSRDFGTGYEITGGISWPHGKRPKTVSDESSDFGTLSPAGFVGLEYSF